MAEQFQFQLLFLNLIAITLADLKDLFFDFRGNMNANMIKLHPEWFAHLGDEFREEYMQNLSNYLDAQKSQGKVIYPESEHLFAALNTTPLSSVRVVILGQDPYHGPNQAHGLSFSVMPGVKVPPSLRNIYKELEADLACTVPSNGHLQAWADQGVLLLNAVLSVEQANAGSHQGKGWERFTDKVIELVNSECSNVVFLLWGAYAQKKGAPIDSNKHLVLKAPHPSPLSAHRGFLGCGHFSKTNEYLRANGGQPIDWQIS